MKTDSDTSHKRAPESPAAWKRVGELFAAAKLRRPEDQRDFLIQQCDGDTDLLKNVLSLLEADAKPSPLDETCEASSLPAREILADRFELIRRVGSGGMGEVFEAWDKELRTRVALKTIRAELAGSPESIDRFREEVNLAKRVTHKNVCRIYDLGIHYSGGTEFLFVTMEFLQGETLAARLRDGPMPSSEAVRLIADMADALSAAHVAGVAHRDFKSANVMLVPGSNREQAIVTDFGLACAIRQGAADTSVLSQGGLAGTVAYMAPEQLKGEHAGLRADLYSLGVVMYEMVAGRRPFESDSPISLALKHINETPEAPSRFAPELDRRMEAVILRCLQKKPEERFESAEAVKRALVDVPATGNGAGPGRRSFLSAILIVGILFLLTVIFGSIQLFRHFGSNSMRVAVLNFDNVGGEKSNEAFCEGLRETITSKLTQLEQFQGTLSVVPASELRKERVSTVRDAQREFGVNLVITGSVERSAAGIRVTINLVDARRLKQIGSRDSFVLLDELPVMEDAVVNDATQLLNLQLNPESRRILAQRSTQSPGAYGYYLQGYGYLHSGHETLDAAITEFQHALEEDPNYALAYAGLGEAYWRKYRRTEDEQWISEAWKMCRRAVSLNSNLAPPHTTLALLYSGTGKFDDAIRESNIALSIDTRNWDAYAQKALALESLGHFKEAEQVLKRTIDLRPESWEGYYNLGLLYYRYGRYKDAEAPFQRTIDLVPDNGIGYANLGTVYYAEGLDDQAEKEFLTSLRLKPTAETYSNLATLYFFKGRFDEAAAIYEKQAAADQNKYTIWGNLGDAYRWSSDKRSKAAVAYGNAIKLAERAVGVNSANSDALSSLGLYYAKSGYIRKGTQYAARALAAAPDDRDVLFAAAVTYELAGERRKALQYLGKAAKLGYMRREILREPELRRLRQDPGFKDLLPGAVS